MPLPQVTNFIDSAYCLAPGDALEATSPTDSAMGTPLHRAGGVQVAGAVRAAPFIRMGVTA